MLFLGCALPLALPAFASQAIDPLVAVVLVGMSALTSGMIKFPIGAGYVVPSYLVPVPMLLLLPPAIVPLLTAVGLILATLGQVLARRAEVERVLFAIPDAWHALEPALVLRPTSSPIICCASRRSRTRSPDWATGASSRPISRTA